MIDTHQLLDKDLNLNAELQAFLNKDSWSNCTDYVTMSIIGAQGTGKSTLINTIFGTEFATKKRNSVGRTTLGANISIIEESENTFVVIDSEGIGWEERLKDCEGDKDKQHVFDTQLTAFILSAVDVLLINIKADQIGQAEAGWSALVRDIMEINKKFIRLPITERRLFYILLETSMKMSTTKIHWRIKLRIPLKNLKRNKDTEDHTSESIEEVESLQNANDTHNIKFEFIPHFTYCKEEFKNSSKSIKSIIQSSINQNQIQIAIGDLTNYLNTNLDTILKNYKYSAKQMIVFWLEMQKEFRDELNYVKEKINGYSNLNQLYQDREVILNRFDEKCNYNPNIKFINQDLIKQEIEIPRKETMELIKLKAKALYKEGIKTLISNFISEIEEEIFLINNKVLNYLKTKHINKINEFISYMNDDWFDLLKYHSSKLPDILLKIDEDAHNYFNLMCIIRYIKNNTVKCFEKYVTNVLNNEYTIFSEIKVNYLVAYKTSLKKYITEMKEYVVANSLTDNNQQQNRIHLNKNFICKVFEQLETKIIEATEKSALNMKNIVREKFEENVRRKARELYDAAFQEILNKYSKYENDISIVGDLTKCGKYLIERMYNYSSIILPSFVWDEREDLIIDRISLETLAEEFNNEWETNYDDILGEVKTERK